MTGNSRNFDQDKERRIQRRNLEQAKLLKDDEAIRERLTLNENVEKIIRGLSPEEAALLQKERSLSATTILAGPDATHGRRMRDGGRQGGQLTAAKNRIRIEARNAEWQAYADELWSRNDGHSAEHVARLIKKKFGVELTTKTIKRNIRKKV